MTIAHVLLVGGHDPDLVTVLAGLADVAREVGAREVHHGTNFALAEYSGGFRHGLTTVMDSRARLEEYLEHPRHHELVRRLEATGATVAVADIENPQQPQPDRTAP